MIDWLIRTKFLDWRLIHFLKLLRKTVVENNVETKIELVPNAIWYTNTGRLSSNTRITLTFGRAVGYKRIRKVLQTCYEKTSLSIICIDSYIMYEWGSLQYFSQLKVPMDKGNINYTKHTFYKINFMKTLHISTVNLVFCTDLVLCNDFLGHFWLLLLS